jgi:hypothetical protein
LFCVSLHLQLLPPFPIGLPPTLAFFFPWTLRRSVSGVPFLFLPLFYFVFLEFEWERRFNFQGYQEKGVAGMNNLLKAQKQSY